jgi:hypothetical protein
MQQLYILKSIFHTIILILEILRKKYNLITKYTFVTIGIYIKDIYLFTALNYTFSFHKFFIGHIFRNCKGLSHRIYSQQTETTIASTHNQENRLSCSHDAKNNATIRQQPSNSDKLNSEWRQIEEEILEQFHEVHVWYLNLSQISRKLY